MLSTAQVDVLGLTAPEDAMLLVVANPAAEGTTVNLLAPVVVNARTSVGAQLILEDQDFPCARSSPAGRGGAAGGRAGSTKRARFDVPRVDRRARRRNMRPHPMHEHRTTKHVSIDERVVASCPANAVHPLHKTAQNDARAQFSSLVCERTAVLDIVGECNEHWTSN